MFTLFLGFVFSCIKPTMINHIQAREYFVETDNCLDILRDKIKSAGCKQMSYRNLNEFDMLFQCHKPDSKRKNFWDTYIFRVSPPNLEYSLKDQAIVDSHTLCIDEGIRIEAYPPN